MQFLLSPLLIALILCEERDHFSTVVPYVPAIAEGLLTNDDAPRLFRRTDLSPGTLGPRS